MDEIEPILDAYPRYVKGQYGIEVREKQRTITREELQVDLFRAMH